MQFSVSILSYYCIINERKIVGVFCPEKQQITGQAHIHLVSLWKLLLTLAGLCVGTSGGASVSNAWL